MFEIAHIENTRAGVLTEMPKALRRRGPTRWGVANGFGDTLGSFLEGPCFDRAGNLYVVDIPYGRIFKIDKELKWECIFEDDGWPNGLASAGDDYLWVADYRKGIRRLELSTQRMECVLGERNSEGFKGVNDLSFDKDGRLYFTDQGQTGLQDPSGRVYRLEQNGRLSMLLGNGPSPNGLAISEDNILYVAMTRANQVWRGPIQDDGSWTKVCALQTFYGIAGPDGLMLDSNHRLFVAHPGLGCVFVLAEDGTVEHVVKGAAQRAIVTNVALRKDSGCIVMTDSRNGAILEARVPPSNAGEISAVEIAVDGRN